MITSKEEAARVELQTHLGSAVRDDVWNYLLENRWVSEYVNGDTRLEDLAEEYRSLDKHFAPAKKSAGPPPPLPPDNRSESLAKIIASEASKIPAVQDFRKRRLRGRLLADYKWWDWIKRHGKKERPKRLDRKALQRCVQFSYTIIDDDDARVVDKSFLHGLPGTSVIAKPGGAIEDLLNTARVVEERFRPAINLQRAVILVLTGKARLPRIISEEHMNYDYPALARIRLEIDPRVKPRELQEYYAKLRNRVLPSRGRVKDRVMTDKHLQLAAFYARVEPPWAEALKQWNADHPEWKYLGTRSGQSNFARDLKSAYERVTGRHTNEIRHEQGVEMLKESFKTKFLREGKSKEEAEKMAEIAARGRA